MPELTLEEVRPTCIYWANKYQSKQFEFNELFNEAYLISIRQKTVLTLQKSIKGGLLRFMMKSQRFTKQCKPFENDNLNSGEENKLALCSKDKCLQSMIDSEELIKIMEEANISQSEEFITILRLRFVDGMTQEQIAKKFHVSQQIISNRYNLILDSLITVNRRRMSCRKFL
jgi:hypothetical protein